MSNEVDFTGITWHHERIMKVRTNRIYRFKHHVRRFYYAIKYRRWHYFDIKRFIDFFLNRNDIH